MTSSEKIIPASELTSYYPYTKHCTIDEHFARRRRVRAFAGASGLRCLDPYTNKRGDFLGDLEEKNGWFDHVTVWLDDDGIPYILVEPYCIENPAAIDGYVYITVPIRLSPYCGPLLVGEQAIPRTRSFLICKDAHRKELLEIERRLISAAPNQPSWNFVEGKYLG